MVGLSRRTFLKTGACAISAGGLAGCTLVGGRLRRYRIEGDPAPDQLAASIDVEGIATPSEDRPLVLRFTFTCDADRATRYRTDTGPFPFGTAIADNFAVPTPTQTVPEAALDDPAAGGTSPTASQPEEPGLERMILTRRDRQARLIDGCWSYVPSEETPTPDESGSVTLDPGESIERDRVLLNHRDNGGCYPIGRYAFSTTYRMAATDRPTDESDPIEWGLTVEITNLEPQ